MTLILPRAYYEDPARFDGLTLARRDPEYIREFLPLLELAYRYYFRVEARGFEHIPRGGPLLFIGNHNGGINSPDTAMTTHAWYTLRGVEEPIHALIHPGIFKIPYLNVHAMKMGGLAATARMALKVLESGASLLLYPGAGDDAYKPYEKRHEILFFGRDAFVRMALRLGVPIVPLVSLGAHETLIVLDDGVERAKSLGLDKLGVERVPATISFPHGLSYGTRFNIPFPAKIEIEAGAPVRFEEHGAKTLRDAAYVKACYDRVVTVMQGMLDRMVAARARRAAAS